MKHVAVYARISRTDDRSTSLEKQVANVRSAAARAYPGLPLVTHTDDGVSGSRRTRTGLDAFIADIASGEVVAAYVDTLDRLTRDRGGLVLWQVLDKCEAVGVPFLGASQPLDLGTASGELSASVMLAAASFERRRVSERIVATNEFKRASGRRAIGGAPPFGLRRRADDPGRLEPDPKKASIVRQALEDVYAGAGYTTIARRWTNEGIPTPYGSPTWHPRTVQFLLTNPALAGMLPHRGGVVHNADGEPFVDPEGALIPLDRWNAIQAALAARKAQHKRAGRSDHGPRPLLYGLAVDTQGLRLYRWAAEGKERRYANRPGTSGARTVTISAVLLEDFVVSALLDEFGEIPEMEERITPGRDLDRLAAIRSSIRRTVAALERAKDRAERQVLYQTLDDLRDAEASIEAENANPGKEWVPTGRSLREAWEATTSDDDRRTILAQAMLRVEVKPGQRGGVQPGGRVRIIWNEEWREMADNAVNDARSAGGNSSRHPSSHRHGGAAS